jgi:hypothetical protein
MKQKKINPYPFFKSANPLLAESNQLDIFKGKTFLEFNEIIGLPIKNNKDYPIFDYELDVIDRTEKHRNIMIKKASGIGATELILRFLTWKILVNNELEHRLIMIVSGTYQQHAFDVKVRWKTCLEGNSLQSN